MSLTTRSAVLTAPQGAVEVRSVDIAAPGPRQVLVRVEACGVCHSDLFVSGLAKLARTPLTLGHEGIGRIEAVGTSVRIGAPATGWASRSWGPLAARASIAAAGASASVPNR